MTTLLEDRATGAQSRSPSEQLRTTMAAVRLSFTWLGVRKTLTLEQRARAAESFGAASEFLSAGKKLLDVRHPAFKAVTAVKNRAVNLWKGMSLPYPEPGVRLIRQGSIDEFNAGMGELRQELAKAVEDLDARYGELKSAARRRLGDLYNAADYPQSLAGMFEMEWDFPSVEPPDYLRQLNPELYEQEAERVAARFDEAVRLAESAFIAELGELVSHLSERLTGEIDGKPKVFRNSAVTNLGEFFEKFRQLNVGSNAELDRLVEEGRRLVQGIEPQALREDGALRRHVATELSGVQSVLDGLMVDRPRRNILRRPR